MARAIKRSRKRPVSPFEAVSKRAEALANDRLGLQIAGQDHVTEVDGELAIDVAKMYRRLLSR